MFANNLQKFLLNTCAIRFFMSFQKAKSYQKLTTKSGSKQRFSLLQEKAVIQAVFLRTHAVSPVLGLKRGLWVFRKSQKILTASDQYYLSYVKKTTGIGLRLKSSSYLFLYLPERVLKNSRKP